MRTFHKAGKAGFHLALIASYLAMAAGLYSYAQANQAAIKKAAPVIEFAKGN